MTQCLVFDLDDTLYSEKEYVMSGFRAVDDYLAAKLVLTDFYRIASSMFKAGERGKIFNQYLDLKGVSHDESLISDLVNVYRTHDPQISLLPDSAWALSHFADKYRLGMITDGYLVAQRKKIDALGISNKFEFIMLTDELGTKYWKPHPRPYRIVQSKFNARAKDCIYVGDNPSKDFFAAKKMGWMTVQVNRNNGEYSQVEASKEFQADQQIDSLHKLGALLNQ